MTDHELMIDNLMQMGCELMSCNAEIHRVEDTVKRMGLAYGAAEMHVFAITSSIIVTMKMPDGAEFTESRRIIAPSGFNFVKMAALNAISRNYCKAPYSPAELQEKIQTASAEETAKRLNGPVFRNAFLRECIGSFIVGGSFALFFGGTPADALVSALVGILSVLIQHLVKKTTVNQLIFQFLNALAIGVVILGIGRLFPALHTDKIMIGDIMLLIPGIAMTNALKDMLVGDTISGLLRLVETILWAAALAAGFMISMLLVRMSPDNASTIAYNVPVMLLLSFFGAVGFGLVFNVPGKALIFATLGGIICYGGFLFSDQVFHLSIFPAAAIGTVLTTLYAQICARVIRFPAPVILIPALVPLIPGSGLYYTMQSVVSQNMEAAKSFGLSTLLCALGMALGMSIVIAVFEMSAAIPAMMKKHKA